jgi:predicted component of type VI protein secretion system
MSIPESKEAIAGSAVLLVTMPEGDVVEHPLRERETTIGRDRSNHICITNHLVSAFHAKIIRSGGTFSLVDLGSANKTRVNGRPVLQKTLGFGDAIQIAGVACRLIDSSEPAEEPTVGREEQDVDGVSQRTSRMDGDRHVTASVSDPWKPPVSRLNLALVALVLFSLAAALATQVC